MAAIGSQRSAEQLATAIVAAAGSSTQVVGVQAFPPSLPFYLKQTIVLSTVDGAELTSNYLVRDIDPWRNEPGTTLRDADWWREAVTNCTRSRVFVLKVDDTYSRTFLEGVLPLIVATQRYAVYGPCGGGRLASEAS
jgi:hypothetical protein